MSLFDRVKSGVDSGVSVGVDRPVVRAVRGPGAGVVERFRLGDRVLVGRVGVLAVALGVGAAVVAFPGVAFADNTGSGGSAASSDSTSGSGKGSGKSSGGPRSGGAGSGVKSGSRANPDAEEPDSGVADSTVGSAGVAGGVSRPVVANRRGSVSVAPGVDLPGADAVVGEVSTPTVGGLSAANSVVPVGSQGAVSPFCISAGR